MVQRVLNGPIFKHGGRKGETNLSSKGMFFSFLQRETKPQSFPKSLLHTYWVVVDVSKVLTDNLDL